MQMPPLLFSACQHPMHCQVSLPVTQHFQPKPNTEGKKGQEAELHLNVQHLHFL